jgi:hypothetical protein
LRQTSLLLVVTLVRAKIEKLRHHAGCPTRTNPMPATKATKELAEATEVYARLAAELVNFRRLAPYAEYERKLLELEAARERCEVARCAMRNIRIKQDGAQL